MPSGHFAFDIELHVRTGNIKKMCVLISLFHRAF